MNLFEGFDSQFNHDSLDAFLGMNFQSQQAVEDHQSQYFYQEPEKNCVTYQWMLSDEDPESGSVERELDPQVSRMRNARESQEQKLKAFISNLHPIKMLKRKSSVLTQESLSPSKKKKIRKALKK